MVEVEKVTELRAFTVFKETRLIVISHPPPASLPLSNLSSEGGEGSWVH